MTEQCCLTERPPKRRNGRLSRVTAAILPAAILAVLPKCPLCLAVWLTLATGVSFSGVGATWVRATIVLLWIAALALVMWRRPFGGASGTFRRLL